MTESTLVKFEEKMLKQVSPLEATSMELLTKAEGQSVTDDKTLKDAVVLKKEINAHAKLVKETRTDLTKPLDDLKKKIMNREAEILLPVEKAKTNIADKILTYEEELERIRLIEEERVAAILQTLTVEVWSLQTAKEVDTKGKQLKDSFAKLSAEDQASADFKLAFRQSVDALTTRKSNLEEEERQRVERERLAKEAESQSAERAALERERAAIAEQERQILAEKERQQREIERQMLEDEALQQRKAELAAEKARPKSNIATITEFEITDPYSVDHKYCSPDDKKIRQAIKDGATEIAGVRIFQTKKVR